MKKILVCLASMFALTLGACSGTESSTSSSQTSSSEGVSSQSSSKTSSSESSEQSTSETSSSESSSESSSSESSSSEVERYTVRWENYDGTELEVDTNVEKGTTPSYGGVTPTRESTAQYTYAFDGWTPEIKEVTEDTTYTAKYTSTLNKYTITWKNYDGTVLETDENVSYGEDPDYDGIEPTKPETTEYTYSFAGWDPSPVMVTEDETYTATFTEVKKDPNSLVMNSGKNKLFSDTEGITPLSGTATVTTEENTTINFAYTNMLGSIIHWHKLSEDGSFYNISPIHSIRSIAITTQTSGGNYKFTCSTDPEFKYNTHTFVYESKLNDTNTINCLANYFKIEGVDGTISISSISISYLNVDYYHNLFTASEDIAKGTVEGDFGDYKVGYTVIVIAKPKTENGYHFVAWKENGEVVSTSERYEFTMPNRDVNLLATWEENQKANVKLNVNDANMGAVVGSGTYNVGETVTIYAFPKEHCKFLYWLDSRGQFYSRAEAKTFIMPVNHLTYTAVFAYQDYTVNISSEDTSKGVAHFKDEEFVHEKELTYLTSFSAEAEARDGYSFAGWFKGDLLISVDNPYTGTVEGDIKLVAKWSNNSYTLNVVSTDESKITVTGGGSYQYGDEVHLKATVVDEHCLFAGWYDGDELVSEYAEFNTIMTSHNRTLTAKWEYKSYTITILLGTADVYPEITGAGTYKYGTEITLKCSIADQDKRGITWSEGNELISHEWSFKYTVDGDHTFVVRIPGFPG